MHSASKPGLKATVSTAAAIPAILRTALQLSLPLVLLAGLPGCASAQADMHTNAANASAATAAPDKTAGAGDPSSAADSASQGGKENAAAITETAKTAKNAPPAKTGQAARNWRETIALQGRLAVQYEENGKQQNMSGSFNWQQDAAQTRVQLASPTGQILAEIVVTPEMASFTQADKTTRSFANADQLTRELLGWPLPVTGLREWLQGFVQQAGGARLVATPAHVDTVQSSDGWRIRYASWHDPEQPKRIDLQHHIEGQDSDVSLRIVLDAQP